MIITKLTGGLGNQMFQYAAGKALALKHSAELKMDVWGYHNPFTGDTIRKYELDIFALEGVFASEREINRYTKHKSLVKKIFKKLSVTYPNRLYYREKNFRFDPGFFDLPGNLYLDGYWQSELYFKDIRTEILADFSLKQPMNRTNQSIAGQIRSVNAVSVHFRRGDYVNNPVTNEYHGVCGLIYYQTAVKMIAGKMADPEFFIFSDDPEWVKNNFKIDFPAHFIDFNKDTPYEDLRLMSLCRHHIIANSSFSWWGAWLNEYPDKIVIAPLKWFNRPDKNQETVDLIPENWLRI